jgi:hypothetical protein
MGDSRRAPSPRRRGDTAGSLAPQGRGWGEGRYNENPQAGLSARLPLVTYTPIGYCPYFWMACAMARTLAG